MLLSRCSPVITTTPAGASSAPMWGNDNFQENLGMVQLYPSVQGPGVNPAIPLGRSVTLNFDILADDYEFLYVKLIHCDYEWRTSNLSELQYLPVYNEFAINDFAYSANTLVNYINYHITLPPVAKSGNYVAVVYRQGESDKPILSRRFLVFENNVAINARVQFSSIVSKQNTHHEIAFDLRYANLEVFNPYSDIKIALLQNHNWEGVIKDLKPTVQRIDQKYLEYYPLNGENNFPAGNEFRFFDARATQYRGQNIAAVFPENGRYVCKLGRDFPRSALPYSGLILDSNGGFRIENTNPGANLLESDYLLVDFQLEAPSYDGDVYVSGTFNQWHRDDRNRMTYDPDRQLYTARLRLKQGFYDFQYEVGGNNNYEIEGSYREAENQYEILVYFSDPLGAFDRIVGYTSLSSRN
ncbi:MAG: type IX secretion system plug protein domain-containing protein [Bacteroidota bacterium]